MNKEQQLFLNLLNSILHPDIALKIDGNDCDLEEVCNLAEQHKVLPLIYHALGISGLSSQLENGAGLKLWCLQSLISQGNRTDKFLRTYLRLVQENIYPLLMKGLICRSCYGDLANLRSSCDEDILVKKEEFYKVKAILEECGYYCEEQNITDSLLEEMQEVTFNNAENEVRIEVHTNPIGHENKIRSKINDMFLNRPVITEEYVTASNETVLVNTFTETDHFLFLIMHAWKHFSFYGFGIRQCIDILMFEEKKREKIDFAEIKKKLKAVGALQFLADIQYIGNEYLGFDSEPVAKPQCPEDLLEDLFLNGIYGNATQAQRTAEGLTSSRVAVEQDSKHGFLRWVYTLFPQKSRMISMHPELVEKPWLLPICWVKRWRRLLRHQKEFDGNLYKESIAISNRRVALLRKYGMVR